MKAVIIDADKPELPDAFCVLNDGSEEFREVVLKWINENAAPNSFGDHVDSFYGKTNGFYSLGKKPFATLLTITQFKTIIQ